MNNSIPELPHNYQPFLELVICSNSFKNGKIPIIIKGNIPFLVGKGITPVIWLSGPESEDGIKWRHFVADNKALDNRINIIIEDELVRASFKSIILIQINKISIEKAEIIKLDLRPLGLNIYGDTNQLNIGTNLFSKNSFIDVNTMIAYE